MINPKEARQTLGLNKSEMARAMGLSHVNTWNKWESGERRMDAGRQRQLMTLIWLQSIGMLDKYFTFFSEKTT